MEHNEGEIGIPMSVGSYGHMGVAGSGAAVHEVNSKLSSSGLQVGGGLENGGEEAVIRSGSHERRNIKYRECLKNHAASIGGHANDGCGEFMPSGEDGTLEALKCAACGCHRNFHRRDTDPSSSSSSSCYYCYGTNGGVLSKRPTLQLPGTHLPLALPASPHGTAIAPRSSHPQMIVAFGGEEHDHMGGQAMYLPHAMKKRFRTKFTQEQKDKMCAFAEKVGWRIQKHDDLAVQQFCMEVGVKRHVLKVWMHNNKHTLAKKP
ncbi:hypothetical protein SUGI_1170180 [Cryptomeria japonica]|nr:hypothetical protein SUGI_1170180 [Cryptomeria japonica]